MKFVGKRIYSVDRFNFRMESTVILKETKLMIKCRDSLSGNGYVSNLRKDDPKVSFTKAEAKRKALNKLRYQIVDMKEELKELEEARDKVKKLKE